MAEKLQQTDLRRSILSLAIFVQLAVVLAGLAAEPRRSLLQQRLTAVFGSYLRPFHLVPDGAKFQLTHGIDTDDDHFIEVELPDGKVVQLPGDEGSRWLGSRRRLFRITRDLALYIEQQDDTAAAEIAIGVASSVMKEHQAEKAVLRCIHMQSQPVRLDRLLPGMPKDDPTAKAYRRVIYTADVLHDSVDNSYSAAKRATRGEVAPTTRSNKE